MIATCNATHYTVDTSNWPADPDGLIPAGPVEVYVYTSGPQTGRAVAVYEGSRDCPYASLDALLEAHSGGEMTPEDLLARLEDMGPTQGPDWAAVLDGARAEWGSAAVQGLA